MKRELFPEELNEKELETCFVRNGEETAKELKQEKSKDDNNMNIKHFTVPEAELVKQGEETKNNLEIPMVQDEPPTKGKKGKKPKVRTIKMKKVIKKRKNRKERVKGLTDSNGTKIQIKEKPSKKVKSILRRRKRGESTKNSTEQKLVQKNLADFLKLSKEGEQD